MIKNMAKYRMRGALLGALLVLFVVPTPRASADEVYNIVIKKQEEKAKGRWSLADWLDTRDRMRMMDLWLAMNSPSPFEFYLGGAMRYSWAPSLFGYQFYGAAYATIFGLQFQYENWGVERMLASFHLRVFGLHNQATNLTPEIGIKQETVGGVTARSPYLGVGLTLYLAKFAGIDGIYRYYLPSTPTAQGTSQTSHRFEGSLFLEFRILRIYGSYFYEPTLNGTTFTPVQGISGGARFYL